MKRNFLLVTSIFVCSQLFSQITKGNWLVGGSGSYQKQQQSLITSSINTSRLQLYPNVGYFFIDKFAGGIKPAFDFLRSNISGRVNQSTAFGIGPFFRYYLLDNDNRVNVFAETDYQHTFYSSQSGQNLFQLSAGPVLYFNTSVGLELTGNYQIIHWVGSSISYKTFFIGIGFQIHLEKDNNNQD